MPEQEPQAIPKTDTNSFIGRVGYLASRREIHYSVPVEVTNRNHHLFESRAGSSDVFVAKRGTELVVSSLRCYTHQYTSEDQAVRSRALAAILEDGRSLDFFAIEVFENQKNGGSHHHSVLVEYEKLGRTWQETIDVNKIAALSAALPPLLWEGDQA